MEWNRQVDQKEQSNERVMQKITGEKNKINKMLLNACIEQKGLAKQLMQVFTTTSLVLSNVKRLPI